MKDFPHSKPLSDTRSGIVDLLTRRAAPDDSDLNRLVAYWNGMRDSHPVPMRRDIDPRAIDRILPNTFILERIAPGLARFRVAGTHLSDLMGMDVRGMPVSTLIEPDARDGFAAGLNAVFDGPARVRLDLRSRGGYGRPGLDGAMVLLPLRSDLGEVSRAVGCIVTRGKPGRAPRRFAVAGRDVQPVLADPAGRPAPPPRKAPAPAVPGGAPFLRLVVSN